MQTLPDSHWHETVTNWLSARCTISRKNWQGQPKAKDLITRPRTSSRPRTINKALRTDQSRGLTSLSRSIITTLLCAAWGQFATCNFQQQSSNYLPVTVFTDVDKMEAWVDLVGSGSWTSGFLHHHVWVNTCGTGCSLANLGGLFS